MFIKFFFTQKSKPSTNVNHKEGKQEETTIDQITKISGSWEKNISGVTYPWDFFPRGALFLGSIFTRGNYVGDKSSKKQFSSGAIFRGQLSLG